MKKKILSLMLCGMMAMGVMAGCGSAGKKSADKKSGSKDGTITVTEVPVVNGKVTFTVTDLGTFFLAI